MESDERLYERLRAGDLAAFDALYARYERRLFAFVRGLIGDAAEAEDVFHEAFMQVLGERPRFDDPARGSFRAWLYTVARNACLNRLRSRDRGQRAHTTPDGEPAPPAADEKLERAEASAALDRALEHLPQALGELYRLRAAGLSYEELARVLDLPLGTVKSRMHELVAQLKKEMRPWTAR
jgi:RNA polymerase sigma-70 factor (ECF subfamily)